MGDAAAAPASSATPVNLRPSRAALTPFSVRMQSIKRIPVAPVLSLLLGSLLAVAGSQAQTPAPRKAAPAKAAPAAAPAKADKIMSIDELRVCMKLQQTNEKNGEEIQAAQDAFKRDQAAVKTEQGEVSKANEALRARMTALTAERDSLSAAVTDLNTKIQTAKKEEEKTALEPERVKLNERNKAFEKSLDEFNAEQKALRDRVDKLNASIDGINQRSHNVNDRVEPHKQSVAQWREQCGNRRYREEDEIVIKKELAAAK